MNKQGSFTEVTKRAWSIANWQIEHRKSRSVLSAHFRVSFDVAFFFL